MEVLLSERPSRRTILSVAMIATVSALLLFGVAWQVFELPGALGALVIWLTFCTCIAVIGLSHEVLYEPATRKIIVRWRNPLLGLRRTEFPLDRFGSVVSYYPYGNRSRSTVCLIERSADRGLNIGSFESKYVSRSFWDLFPALVEADEARKLRLKLSSLLGVQDAGYIGVRWLVRGSK